MPPDVAPACQERVLEQPDPVMTRTRLLVVDDEEPNRDMLARRLQRHGYDVDVASSGAEALAVLAARVIDVVLLDIQMPGMTGLEVLRTVRQSCTQAQLPVIMVTAKTESDAVVEALGLGANDYITKPVDLPVALARIRTQVGLKAAERLLADSEERYALAVRGSRDGLWDWRTDVDQVFFSARWNEIFGYAVEEVTGPLDRWLDRVHADDSARVRAEFDNHLAGRSLDFEIEHRVCHAPGQYRWVLARGAAVRNVQGRPVRLAGSVTDITEGKVADALTGLPNRVSLMDRLSRLIDHRRLFGGPEFALFFFDLDRFKNVNDTLGHRAGDDLLVQVARRLEEGLRSLETDTRGDVSSRPPTRLVGDTLARMGGDEFALLLSGVRHAADSAAAATRIGALLADPIEIEGQSVFTSASIGIALSATSAESAPDMLRDADTALYRAKAAGRSRFEIFDQAMRQEVVERVALEADLRRAIDQRQFTVHYQPIVSLSEKTVTSIEALVRWPHPERGLMSASEFVPVAEAAGLMGALGSCVFDEVCRQIAAWGRVVPSLPQLTVAVNVSGRQLAQADLPEQLAAIAARHGVPTSMLEIEIAESTTIANLDEVETVILRLKALGFRLSIDDFGTGYSSFTYLKRLPVDRLKIDRSLVAGDLHSSPLALGMLGTVVGLARHLDLEVVAEGVETPDQLEHLRRIECGFGQGYVFLEPVDPDPMSRLLLSGLGPAAGERATDGAGNVRVTARAGGSDD